MKILCIIQCSNLGGMEQSKLNSLKILKEQGHEVCFYSLNPVGQLSKLLEKYNIPIFGTTKYKAMGLGNILEIVKFINNYRPDRIWLSGHNFGSLIASRICNVPTYLSIHFHHADRSFLLWRLFYFLTDLFSVKVHFVSDFIYSEVSSLFRKKNKPVVFTNMFDKPKINVDKSDARNLLNIDENDFLIGNAGWLIKRKAFDVFIETAALVVKEIPDAIFLIAGDGEEKDNLVAQAEQLGIKNRIIFLGWQEDLSTFYHAIDVLLFNSNFDALGRSPLEAVVREALLVASVTNGGLKEYIRHGMDGFLIDHHDPAQLSDEIIRLHHLGESESIQKQKKRAKQRVLTLGSKERHILNVNEFLELE
ncbi:glycosyltransferase family 4 protein [Vibrio diabolicus]|uniref:Glycosyltransferase family 4 protein n=1 Tax=Vibrio diabolicus TaxID=50719 RepID=A0AA92LQZ7_9VIBR|nr:glycosyltransferase family 4 protein [Vibrio diabolicus]QRG82648.1 glycosyltransferase family 4 protein [Vibrio diabolicus]